jgi:tetratricopeptide (TPR) repeat protein
MIQNYEKAKMYAHRASEKDRMYIDAYYARHIENNSEKRLRILEKMTKIYPKEKRIYYDLGVFYHGVRRDDESIDILNKVLQLDPEYGPAYNMLSYVYGDRGEFNKAEEALNRYLKVSPGEANPYDSMAELYLRMGDFEKAKENYKKSMSIKPDFVSRYRIAYIYALEEDFSGAIEWTNRAIGSGITNVRSGAAYWYRAYYYYLSGNPAIALAEIDSTINITRKFKSRIAERLTNWLRAWIYLDRSDIPESVSWYNQSYQSRIELNPQYLTNFQADRAYYKGLIYLSKSEIDSAKLMLQELDQLLPNVTPNAMERMEYRHDVLNARILLAENLLEDAEDAYRTIRRTEIPFQFRLNMLVQNFPFMQDDLAQAYQKNGNIDKAIAEYEKLIRFDPSSKDWRLRNPRYHYRLGLLYEQKGWKEKAAQAYQKFLDICVLGDKNNPEIIDASRRLAVLKN